MKKVFYLFALVIFLQGCATRNSGQSYVGKIENPSIFSSISKDLVTQLTEQYPRGYTEFSLQAPKKKDNFSVIFENALRKQGYSLMPSAPLKLSYTLDKLANGEYYIQLRYGDKALARMYTKDGKPHSLWTQKVGEHE